MQPSQGVSSRVARRVGVSELPKPRRSRKDPGLLHALQGVAIETVRRAMKKPCVQCGDLPALDRRRLVVRTGAGRYGKTDVRCERCGDSWLRDQQTNYLRAIAYLRDGKISDGDRRRPDLEVEGIRD